jgi:hypothetical protein
VNEFVFGRNPQPAPGLPQDHVGATYGPQTNDTAAHRRGRTQRWLSARQEADVLGSEEGAQGPVYTPHAKYLVTKVRVPHVVFLPPTSHCVAVGPAERGRC